MSDLNAHIECDLLLKAQLRFVPYQEASPPTGWNQYSEDFQEGTFKFEALLLRYISLMSPKVPVGFSLSKPCKPEDVTAMIKQIEPALTAKTKKLSNKIKGQIADAFSSWERLIQACCSDIRFAIWIDTWPRNGDHAIRSICTAIYTLLEFSVEVSMFRFYSI